jgi:hypothetical protein
MEIRRLRPGDEHVVARLAGRGAAPRCRTTKMTIFLVAFDDIAPDGFAFGYDVRRRGATRRSSVYEVDVRPPQAAGVASGCCASSANRRARNRDRLQR